MLRRARQIRTQIHQLVDAFLFASSFWIAYAWRNDPFIIDFFNLPPIDKVEFDTNKLLWLYAALIPAAPLILESQGFYSRPALGSRLAVLWPLFKGCLITSLGLVLAMYAMHLVTPRAMMVFFGVISFSLVFAKEELVRWVLLSRVASSQSKRRFILVGTEREIIRMRADLQQHVTEGVEIVAELNLVETPVQQI